MPFVMWTVLDSPSLFDFTMVDAVRMLGRSYRQALRKVLVPNILPGFVGGGGRRATGTSDPRSLLP